MVDVQKILLGLALFLAPISSYAIAHTRGNPQAPATVTLYMDFECPFCRKFEPTIDYVLKAYSGAVKVTYMDFPLSFHALATPAAVAAECVYTQSGETGYFKAVDALFAKTELTSSTINSLSSLVSDRDAFDTCQKDSKNTSSIADVSPLQTEITGTPTSILSLNGKKIKVSGAVEKNDFIRELKKLPWRSVKQSSVSKTQWIPIKTLRSK